jgi:uncharacterized membrane protein
MKGLGAVLPVGITLYLIWWLGVTVERVVRPLILLWLPEHLYWPGMGLLVGLGLLFCIGVLVNAWLVRHLLRLGEAWIERIPLVKSVHGALRDFIQFFSAANQREDLQQVVLVQFDEIRLLGFITAEDLGDLSASLGDEEMVGVYFPMSYQIGGYTAYLPRSRLQPLDMPVEDAMRRVLTAGLSSARSKRQ